MTTHYATYEPDGPAVWSTQPHYFTTNDPLMLAAVFRRHGYDTLPTQESNAIRLARGSNYLHLNLRNGRVYAKGPDALALLATACQETAVPA